MAVEPMTRALGVTKGSFYWHFANRDALVHETLGILMFAGFEDLENGRFLAALCASSEDPRVQPYLQRVSENRLALVTASFEALGLSGREARMKALLACSACVGCFHLFRAMPDLARGVSDLSACVRSLADVLVPSQVPLAPLRAPARRPGPPGACVRRP